MRMMRNYLQEMSEFLKLWASDGVMDWEYGKPVATDRFRKWWDGTLKRRHTNAIINMLVTSGQWDQQGEYVVLKNEYNDGTGALAYHRSELSEIYPQLLQAWRHGVTMIVSKPPEISQVSPVEYHNHLSNTLMMGDALVGSGIQAENSEVQNDLTAIGNAGVSSSIEAHNSQVNNTVRVVNNSLAFLQRESRYPWLEKMIGYCTILLYGPPGSGKTTMALHIISERVKRGHAVVVLDSHNQRGKWGNLPVYGGGKNYEEIVAFLSEFTNEVDRRYQEYNEGKQEAEFEKMTIVVEEFTNWSDKVANATNIPDLIPDARKVGIYLLMVAHSDTLSSLGGKAGSKDRIEQATMSLGMKAKEDPHGLEPAVPAMKGDFKPPSKKKIKANVQEVRIPELDRQEISRVLAMET